MENKYIYIDESGDTGYTKKSTRYFILTAVIVDDCFVLKRIVKNIHKFKIDKKKTNMIHSYKENNIVKNKLVKKLKELRYLKCKCFVFDKTKVKEKDLYFHGLSLVAQHFYKSELYTIIIARRDTRLSHNSKIISIFKNYGIDADFSYPNVEKSLQISDFYSWSIFSHLELDSSEYYLKLETQVELIDTTKPLRHV